MRQRSIYADVACVCKHPFGHLNVCQLSGIPLGGTSTQSDSIMQHERGRTPPVFFLCEGSPVPTPADSAAPPRNFAETLPTEMSVRIFGELDAVSLCSAARTCRLWHQIIEQSEQLWRRQCLLVRALCQREVDSDRRHGLSWKVTLVRNYIRSCVKRDWLIGRFSHVRSADELKDRKLMPLDAETWGEILQAELDR